MLRVSLRRALSVPALGARQMSSAAAAAAPSQPSQSQGSDLQLPQMTDLSKRTGLLALKVGMIGLFDKWGQRVDCTVLYVDNCQVVQVKTEETDGYTAVQLGVGQAKPKNVHPAQTKHFVQAGVEPKRKLGEFRVTADALLPVGTYLTAKHFVPGQLVDVCGISKGKGFQGVVKRWGFKMGNATHGNSLSHRIHGSTGATQGQGRVWKGKKMAGRMGSDRVTVQNLWVFKVDPYNNLIYVKGHVPGNKGQWVRVTDAVKGPEWPSPPPFPTHVFEEGEDMSEILAPQGETDVLKPVEPEDAY